MDFNIEDNMIISTSQVSMRKFVSGQLFSKLNFPLITQLSIKSQSFTHWSPLIQPKFAKFAENCLTLGIG